MGSVFSLTMFMMLLSFIIGFVVAALIWAIVKVMVKVDRTTGENSHRYKRLKSIKKATKKNRINHLRNLGKKPENQILDYYYGNPDQNSENKENTSTDIIKHYYGRN